jgi:hypothetical protein
MAYLARRGVHFAPKYKTRALIISRQAKPHGLDQQRFKSVENAVRMEGALGHFDPMKENESALNPFKPIPLKESWRQMIGKRPSEISRKEDPKGENLAGMIERM